MPLIFFTLTIFVALLSGVAIGIFALLITGIRRGGRTHLANAPKSHAEAIARRILVGVRYQNDRIEDEEEER